MKNSFSIFGNVYLAKKCKRLGITKLNINCNTSIITLHHFSHLFILGILILFSLPNLARCSPLLTSRQEPSLSPNTPNSTTNEGASSPLDKYKKQLEAAAFSELSKMAFRSLQGEHYIDRPLENRKPGTGLTLKRNYRKKLRKNQTYFHRPYEYKLGTKVDNKLVIVADRNGRQKIPNRRQAYIVANKELMKDNSQPRCRTELLKQRVRVEGCLTKTVTNKFCFGQCNSFFIPKLRKKKLKAAFQSCSLCMPIATSRVRVTLHCPSQNPPLQRKMVLKVKDCACKAIPPHTLEEL